MMHFLNHIRFAPILASLLGVSLTQAVQAQELRVNAPIVAVTQLTAAAPLVCDVEAPARAAGLAAALRWDLRGRCRDSAEPVQVTGYSVVYEWDGRRFTTVLPEPPTGDSLALRLQID